MEGRHTQFKHAPKIRALKSLFGLYELKPSDTMALRQAKCGLITGRSGLEVGDVDVDESFHRDLFKLNSAVCPSVSAGFT
jgi:hypothetical protein